MSSDEAMPIVAARKALELLAEEPRPARGRQPEYVRVYESDRRALRSVLDDHARLVQHTEELRRGDGRYYVTEERAMAPGISGTWPAVIPHPTSPHGRLVRREFSA